MNRVDNILNTKPAMPIAGAAVVLATAAVAIALIAMLGRFHVAQVLSKGLGSTGTLAMLGAGGGVGALALAAIARRIFGPKTGLNQEGQAPLLGHAEAATGGKAGQAPEALPAAPAAAAAPAGDGTVRASDEEGFGSDSDLEGAGDGVDGKGHGAVAAGAVSGQPGQAPEDDAAE